MTRRLDQPLASNRGVLDPASLSGRRDWALPSEAIRAHLLTLPIAVFLMVAVSTGWAADSPVQYEKRSTWPETMRHAREAWRSAEMPVAERPAAHFTLCEAIKTDFPVPWDWAIQDGGKQFLRWFEEDANGQWEKRLIRRALGELAGRGERLRGEFDLLCQAQAAPTDARWWNLYVRICQERRALRLRTLQRQAPRIVFIKCQTVRPSFFAYTEGQSDAQNERHFRPGSAMCLLEIDKSLSARAEAAALHEPFPARTLVEDPSGVIRDPCVSWDGHRILFAWKKSLDDDDYHLYEMPIATGLIRQITFGQGFADYEPAYLPNGHVVFASTRCVQTVDCWWTEVSNLYTCDGNGRYLRRLGFDQVHTVYPQVLGDGRVIYTRWDYNDRSQMWPQALFQMNADGTGQREYYKNNSWFPTTIAHARGIPGTEKVMAIFTGHHTAQAGKVGILDTTKGNQENLGAQLIAPIRPTVADRRDTYGQDGELLQYPYPLTQTEFLVGYAPLGWKRAHEAKGGADFGIYWMDVNGRRELLATDAALACQQPAPLVARTPPPIRPSTIDYRETTGTYYMQDVYAGAALAGIPRGTVKKLRVISLDFRAAGVGNNGNIGPGGEGLVSTPIAIGNGSWDVKRVLGDAKVYDDGSAFFSVPARTPVYFQALDARNHAVQSMRSWSTLQPGENQGCVGCHEAKNTTPRIALHSATLALKAGPRNLSPFYGPPRGFSFAKEIQPMLDRHCVRCHNDRSMKVAPTRLDEAPTRQRDPAWIVQSPSLGWPKPIGPRAADRAKTTPAIQPAANRAAFSLLGQTTTDNVAKRSWSDAYLNLTLASASDYYEAVGAHFGVYDGKLVNWIGSQSIPAPLPPYMAGACRSGLFSLLAAGHYGVNLSQEDLDKLACWIDLLVPYCGDYLEANTWDHAESEKYEHFFAKRKGMEEIERRNIRDWVNSQPEDDQEHGRSARTRSDSHSDLPSGG
jgi:hypothetical protein